MFEHLPSARNVCQTLSIVTASSKMSLWFNIIAEDDHNHIETKYKNEDDDSDGGDDDTDQCVAVPKMFNDTDTDTFFLY